jgi:hypothetical protein
MAIEIEYFSLTGMEGNCGITGMLLLKMPPTTGPNNSYDVAVDPVDGPAQSFGTDFGVTSSGLTGYVYFDLLNSDIRRNILHPIQGVTGPIELRVLYNGFSGM